ncbi:MAG: hypothetical protein JNL87_01325 [Burkholderiaceae bacterium]|nr:hypothetical protein [Burkholderiaceae bacterium]
MSAYELRADLVQTFERKPLAVVDGLPGDHAELTPAQLRALSAALLRIADDADAQPMGVRTFKRQRRAYPLASTTR